MDHLAEAHFVRRVFLRRNQSLLTAGVVHFDEQQSGFNARDIQRQHSSRMDVELPTSVHNRVPDFNGVIPWNPDLVPQVARVTGAGDVYKNVTNLAASHSKILEIGDVGFGHRLEQLARSWALQRQGGKLL